VAGVCIVCFAYDTLPCKRVLFMATYHMQTRLVCKLCKLLPQSLDLHPMDRLRGGEFNHLNPHTNTFVNKKLSNPTLDAIPVSSRAKRDTRILAAPRLSGRTPPRLGLHALATTTALLAAPTPLNRAGRLHRIRRRHHGLVLVLLRGLLGRRTTQTRRCMSCRKEGVPA
jgi:hypothetical protein